MKKGHVGRPTNEEVAARKRKQLLKVLLPLILIGTIAIMIISQTGLKGLMGDTTSKKCEPCEEGWTEDGEQCYQETNQTSQINAYILGDANNNGIVNSEDYEIIEQAVNQNTGSVASNNTIDLDERQESVYDINGDHTVNSNDIVAFNEYFSQTTSGKTLKEDYQVSYVCPRETVTETTDENNQIIKTTTTYKPNEQNETLCDVTTITKVTKNRVCTEDKEDSKEEIQQIPSAETETQATEECPEPGMKIVYSEKLKSEVCVYSDLKQIVNSEDADYQMDEENDNTVEEASETTTDEFEEETEAEASEDEYGYINKQSNYLSYGDPQAGNLVIYTKNSVTGSGLNALYVYNVFTDENCSSNGQNTSIPLDPKYGNDDYSNFSTEVIKVDGSEIKANKYTTAKRIISYNMFRKLRVKNQNNQTVEQLLNNGQKVTLYVNQYIDSNYYEQGTSGGKTCVPVTITKDKDTTLTFENKPKNTSAATVVVAFNKNFENRPSTTVKHSNKKLTINKNGNSYLYITNGSKYFNGFKGSNSTKKVKKYYKPNIIVLHMIKVII